MSNPQFNFTRYKAFGWILHRKTLKTGEIFHVEVPSSYNPDVGYNISLWTKGLVTGIDRLSGKPTDRKVPGSSVLDREEVPKSKNEFVAREPSEFWCINYLINRRKLPKVEILKIPAFSSLELPMGSKILFCAGSFTIKGVLYEPPISLEFTSQAQTVYAREDTYGFIFEEPR